MKRPTSTTVPDSLIGELRSLVRLYRGGSVFPHGGAPDGVEVAVVLGAQILPGGRPSETLRSRVEHAAQLYAQGRVRLIIPTGGVGKHPPSEAEVAASILREAGVSTEAILLEEEARNTRESARMVATRARERGIRSGRQLAVYANEGRVSGRRLAGERLPSVQQPDVAEGGDASGTVLEGDRSSFLVQGKVGKGDAGSKVTLSIIALDVLAVYAAATFVRLAEPRFVIY